MWNNFQTVILGVKARNFNVGQYHFFQIASKMFFMHKNEFINTAKKIRLLELDSQVWFISFTVRIKYPIRSQIRSDRTFCDKMWSDLLGSTFQNLNIESDRTRVEKNVIGSEKNDVIGLLGPARYFPSRYFTSGAHFWGQKHFWFLFSHAFFRTSCIVSKIRKK
jgi:hypothetical protein